LENQKIYPVRFVKCNNINHVFDLSTYLDTVYNFRMNENTKKHYNLSRLSPDSILSKCPLCDRSQ